MWTALAAAAATVAGCEPRHDRSTAGGGQGRLGYEYRFPGPYRFKVGGGTAGTFRLMASGNFDARTGCALMVNAFGSLPRPFPLWFLVLPGRVWVRVDGDPGRRLRGWKPQYANEWLQLEPVDLPPSIVALTSLGSDPTGVSAVLAAMTDVHQIARPAHGPASPETDVDPVWREGYIPDHSFRQGRVDLDGVSAPITKLVPAMWRPDPGSPSLVTVDLEYGANDRPSLICYPGTEPSPGEMPRSWYGVVIDRFYDALDLQPPEQIRGTLTAETMGALMEAAGLPAE